MSLVALHFADTRVYGIPVPTAQCFPEMNLSFYVRRGLLRLVADAFVLPLELVNRFTAFLPPLMRRATRRCSTRSFRR